jgi:competence ComEA-like helix-hairpin-helix protein
MAWRSCSSRLFLFFLFLSLICSSAVLGGKKKPPLKPVNINAATSEELQQVPGIGPATAEKILQMRKSYGAFKSVDDLLAIRGLGAKRLEKMRKYLIAGKTNSKTAAPAAGCTGCAKSAAKSSTPPAASRPAVEPEEPPR